MNDLRGEMEQGKLSIRQLKTIANFLAAPSIEETCRRSNISKNTFYKWIKDTAFLEETNKQRDKLIKDALSRLKCSINKATNILIELLGSKREEVRRLVSKDIIDYTLKSIEMDGIEQRLNKLEDALLNKNIK